MTQQITVSDRFRGPPRSGNGGYVAGIIANTLGLAPSEPVEVTLRSPVPLDSPLQVTHEGNQVTVSHGETLIATARPDVALDMHIPEPPDFMTALAVRNQSVCLQQREDSPLPGAKGLHPICFCCGANHETGLHVYSAPVDEQQVAAAWQTEPHWAGEDGNLPLAFLWTALDCPGQLAFFAQGKRTGLMGRMTAAVHSKVSAGEPLVVTAWPVDVDGKKHLAGSAIFNAHGELVANALAVWFSRS
ncbi:MAG: hypothetical protein KDI36_00300 [Pseudomonadales bacterium]|nr:hypothetical protein [Pseudomonadales bacterium]